MCHFGTVEYKCGCEDHTWISPCDDCADKNPEERCPQTNPENTYSRDPDGRRWYCCSGYCCRMQVVLFFRSLQPLAYDGDDKFSIAYRLADGIMNDKDWENLGLDFKNAKRPHIHCEEEREKDPRCKFMADRKLLKEMEAFDSTLRLSKTGRVPPPFPTRRNLADCDLGDTAESSLPSSSKNSSQETAVLLPPPTHRSRADQELPSTTESILPSSNADTSQETVIFRPALPPMWRDHELSERPGSVAVTGRSSSNSGNSPRNDEPRLSLGQMAAAANLGLGQRLRQGPERGPPTIIHQDHGVSTADPIYRPGPERAPLTIFRQGLSALAEQINLAERSPTVVAEGLSSVAERLREQDRAQSSQQQGREQGE